MAHLLDHPLLYEFAQTLSGWYSGTQRKLVKEFVKPYPGMRVLDVGCASGHVLKYLPDADYTGLDLNPDYVRRAKKRFPHARFMVADAASPEVAELGVFDCIMLFGLLHHLNDDEATTLLATARRLVGPSGKVISVDNCWYEGQSALERFFVRHDRGKFARTADGYRALSLKSFCEANIHIRHGMQRVPYALLVMESRA